MPSLASLLSGVLRTQSIRRSSPILPIGIISYLVVAGGGSTGLDGGTTLQGGGGAGGFLTGTVNVASGLTFTMSVGAGGGVNASGSNSYIRSSDTVTLNVESMGGGRGGIYHPAVGYRGPENGGSGGGNAGPLDGTGFVPGGLGTPGQGNNGGGTPLTPGGFRSAAGGGGAGSAGQNGVSGPSGFNGVGGNGLASPISGTPVTYSVGGSANPGGSGAAGSGNGADAGVKLGGSGVIFVRASNGSISTYTGSPIITSIGDGNTIFKFTGTGTLEFV